MGVKITKTLVDRATAPAGKQQIYWDSDLKGFGLRVAGDRKTYVVQHRVRGRSVRHTLGLHGHLTPDEARRAARQLLGDMTRGVDPNHARKSAQQSGLTLKDIYTEYVATRRLEASTIRSYERALDVGFAEWKAQPLVALTREMVLRRFEELSRSGPAQANQMFRFLRALINFGMERFRSPAGDPLIPSNPCNVLSVLGRWNRVPPRTRYVHESFIPSVFDALIHDPLDTPHRNDIRDFCAGLLLTGCREQEIAALQWSNVDLRLGTLTFPKTKNGDSHTLPMGKWLWQLMRRRREAALIGGITSVFVFPAPNKSGHLLNHRKGLRSIADAAGVEFTPHDLRRTFATLASQTLGGDRSYFLVARLLNHRKSDVTSRYVQIPLEQLRAAMQAIETFMVGARPDLTASVLPPALPVVPQQVSLPRPVTRIRAA